MLDKKLQIRNSTVDFLVFTKDSAEDSIEVRVQDGDVWLTQKAIGQLFDTERSVVTKHLKNIFDSGELNIKATCANFAQVADHQHWSVVFHAGIQGRAAFKGALCLACVKHGAAHPQHDALGAQHFDCDMTVMEEGEHWFHTPEQLAVLRDWELLQSERHRRIL